MARDDEIVILANHPLDDMKYERDRAYVCERLLLFIHYAPKTSSTWIG